MENINLRELSHKEMEETQGGGFFVGFLIGLAIFAIGALIYNSLDNKP
jgi:hypothetical protein